jgi:hypothetical protein
MDQGRARQKTTTRNRNTLKTSREETKSAYSQPEIIMFFPSSSSANKDDHHHRHSHHYNTTRHRLTITQWCFVVSLICSGWNLLGDLYYLDYFWVFTNTNESMAVISKEVGQPNVFSASTLQSSTWLKYLVEAGGWMYPIWAVVTVIPLFPAFLGIGRCCNGDGDDDTSTAAASINSRADVRRNLHHRSKLLSFHVFYFSTGYVSLVEHSTQPFRFWL